LQKEVPPDYTSLHRLISAVVSPSLLRRLVRLECRSLRTLVIMHAASEGPGTLGTFLESVAAKIFTARLYAGDRLPPDPRLCDAIISMGGPMNVYEEDVYSFLRDETLFLQKAILFGVPVLGICLGAQMIAKATGALVIKSPQKEVGWGKVALTSQGRRDPLFRGLPKVLNVFQWHEDMFEIPDGGELLATSGPCPHQAFRYRTAVGLQFHVEVTEEILSDWFEDSAQHEEVIAGFRLLEDQLAEQALRIYRNFLNLIG